MNFHVPNFNVKNFVKEAGSTFSRVVQLTEERLGTTERTEYDAEFQNLAGRADVTKMWTEKILKDIESVLVPNPQNRLEDFIFGKVDKTKPRRLSNLEYLAFDMLEAGADFGQDLPYGQALIKVGEAEQELGKSERIFIDETSTCYISPLRNFLNREMKVITKSRGELETKRLNLDACKKRVTKARNMLGQEAQKDGVTPEAILEQAEHDLRVAQSEFGCKTEVTKATLEGIRTCHSVHLSHLYMFVDAQARYYKHCNDVMDQLQLGLANLRGSASYQSIKLDKRNAFGGMVQGIGGNPFLRTGNEPNHPISVNADQMKRARVLCAYDGKDHTELTLNANEVILVTECSPVNTDYMYGKQGLLNGLVPRAFLEMLDDDDDDDDKEANVSGSGDNDQPLSGDSDY